jgi:hypothetical protein
MHGKVWFFLGFGLVPLVSFSSLEREREGDERCREREIIRHMVEMSRF